MEKHRLDKRNILYHYCNVDAFFNIIKSKTLRLTDMINVNDYVEVEIVRIMLERIFYDLQTENKYGYLLEQIYIQIFTSFGQIEMAACFSRGRDKLSQWRAYTNNGKGFSIGFDFSDINLYEYYLGGFHIQEDMYIKKEIQYVGKDSRDFRGFDEVRNQLKEKIINILEEKNEEKRFFLCNLFINDLSTIKHYTFSEEEETRIMTFLPINLELTNPLIDLTASRNIHFYEKNKILKSYLDFSFKENNICEIVLGPKNNATKHVIKKFLQSEGYIDFDVFRSCSTYQ